MVFIDDGSLSQMILCAEKQEIAEIPGKKLVDGLFHLLASYYVYGVAYLKGAQPFCILCKISWTLLLFPTCTGNSSRYMLKAQPPICTTGNRHYRREIQERRRQPLQERSPR